MNNYDDLLRRAIDEYLRTGKSQYQVAKEYGIPRSTLNDHIRRRYGYVDEDMGRRALGLPSIKVASDKSRLLASVGSDMSGRTSEEEKPHRSDMSEAEARTTEMGRNSSSDMSGGHKSGKSGSKIPYGVIVIAAIAVGVLALLYWGWRRFGGDGDGRESGPGPELELGPPSGQGMGAPEVRPKPYHVSPDEESELIEKWRREFDVY